MAAEATVTVALVGRLLGAYLLLATIAGAGVLVLRYAVPSARGPVLPPQRLRATPWRGFHVAGLVVLWLIWDVVAASAFGLGVSMRPAAASLAAHLAASIADGVRGGVEGIAGTLAGLAQYQVVQAEYGRQLLLATVLSRCLQAGTLIWVLRNYAGAEYYQLGLSFHRWAKDLIAGGLTWLLLTPVVFAVFLTALGFEPRTPHVMEELLQGDAGWLEWTLALVITLAAAPLVEELLFRGILQPWFVRSPGVADHVVLLSLMVAIGLGVSGDRYRHALAFLVAAGLGYPAWELALRRWLPRPGVARSIFVTALLFAAIHFDAWPAPIPLFFLGLGLGWLAYRTQSIIGPIVAHALFNAVSLLMLVLPK